MLLLYTISYYKHDYLFPFFWKLGILEFGQLAIQCEHCMAEVWYEERSDKTQTYKKNHLSICCQKGKVQLPFLQKLPQLIQRLYNGQDSRINHYLQNIGTTTICFHSLQLAVRFILQLMMDVDLILNGQNYHRIGSLLPESGQTPKFAQLYIYDTENEVKNRVSNFE